MDDAGRHAAGSEQARVYMSITHTHTYSDNNLQAMYARDDQHWFSQATTAAAAAARARREGCSMHVTSSPACWRSNKSAVTAREAKWDEARDDSDGGSGLGEHTLLLSVRVRANEEMTTRKDV